MKASPGMIFGTFRTRLRRRRGGYFLGRWLDKQFDTKPYLAILFIVLGFIAAGREIWGLIKHASRDSDGK